MLFKSSGGSRPRLRSAFLRYSTKINALHILNEVVFPFARTLNFMSASCRKSPLSPCMRLIQKNGSWKSLKRLTAQFVLLKILSSLPFYTLVLHLKTKYLRVARLKSHERSEGSIFCTKLYLLYTYALSMRDIFFKLSFQCISVRVSRLCQLQVYICLLFA